MLYDGEFVREVLQGVLLICMGRRLVICLVGWCRLAAKKKGESFDSPFFFIYKLSDLEFIPPMFWIIYTSVAIISKFEIIVFSTAFIV